VDFVTGCDASSGSVVAPEAHALSQLYFCDGCSRVVSRRDLAEDVDSYYCPNCLENMPSSEAMLYGMRCSKCWECPVCSSTLPAVARAVGGQQASPEQTYQLACSYCRWSSGSQLDVTQPEQLIAQIIALEREGEPRQRMAALVDAFRTRAQEQQRERELAVRLKRRSSLPRGSFAPGSLGAYAARRFSSALMLRAPRLSHAMPHPGLLQQGLSNTGGGGPWRLDDLECKLHDQVDRAADLRAEARAAAAAAAAKADEAAEKGINSPTNRSPSSSLVGPISPGVGALRNSQKNQAAPELPVLGGLSVDELLEAHVQPGPNGELSLLAEMNCSLEDDVKRGAGGVASAAQRLQQVAYGYTRTQGGVVATSPPVQPGKLRTGVMQLEAPLQHMATWSLLPVRKPLMTKRSRKCRLLTLRGKGDSVEQQSPTEKDACLGTVVKPQINPCSIPPFQKNNMAVSFVPRCTPYLWALTGQATVTSTNPPLPWLKAGEQAELVFFMANPLDSDMDFSLEPQAFNGSAVGGPQNVEVLTPAFDTIIPKFQDLADVHEVWGEETERMKAVREKDNPDIIPERKLHKLLVRLRFRNRGGAGNPVPWVFFVRATLSFIDPSKAKHRVQLVLRFTSEAPTGPVRNGAFLVA